MPLRDHFRAPLDDLRHWESFLAGWPVMMVATLRNKLPRPYFAEPWVQPGATTAWATQRLSAFVHTNPPTQDVYEVRVFDERHNGPPVAVVKVVSPGNKESQEDRRAFVSKCVRLVREHVSLVVVDMVTTHPHNLNAELLDSIGNFKLNQINTSALYAVACRTTKRDHKGRFEVWAEPLGIGQPLPTMPLWLAEDVAVPLELEESYQQNCEILGIP